MRNANAQRPNTMIRVGALRQPARAACQSCGDRGLAVMTNRKIRCAIIADPGIRSAARTES
jgi:hypothetical protein